VTNTKERQPKLTSNVPSRKPDNGMIVRGRHDGKHYGAAAVGKPGEKDLTICEELGKRTAELAASLLRK